MASKAFLEFILSHDSCLWNVYGRFIAGNLNERVRQEGNLCYPVMREEQRNERIPCVCARVCEGHHSFHVPQNSWAPRTSLRRETETGCAMLRRERRVLRQLNIWCSYLFCTYFREACSILALFQRAFLHGTRTCMLRMSLRSFTGRENW